MIITDSSKIKPAINIIKEKFEKYISDNNLRKIYTVKAFEGNFGQILVLNKHFVIPLIFKEFFENSRSDVYIMKEPLAKISDIAIRIDVKDFKIFVKHPKTSPATHPHALPCYGNPYLIPDGYFGTCVGSLTRYLSDNPIDYFKSLDEATSLFLRATLDSSHASRWIEHNKLSKNWRSNVLDKKEGVEKVIQWKDSCWGE